VPSALAEGAGPDSNVADNCGLAPNRGESDCCDASFCDDRTDCAPTAAPLRSILPLAAAAAAKVEAGDAPFAILPPDTSADSAAGTFRRGEDGLFNTGMGRGFALWYGSHVTCWFDLVVLGKLISCLLLPFDERMPPSPFAPLAPPRSPRWRT
jgi:hypothetical protein